MDFITYSHQNADLVLDTPKIKPLYEELTRVINEIQDAEIINEFNAGTPSKSLSLAINRMMKVCHRRDLTFQQSQHPFQN
jgi:hypothetical protein